MSTEDEELLIGEVLTMKEQGFETSRSEVLPNLYVRRYGQMYRENCGGCIRDAYDNLIKWATKKKSTNKQHSMGAYKIKHEYRNKNFPVRVKGQRLFINSDNLTDDRAQLLLAVPKYAHVLEPTGEGFAVTTPVVEKQRAVKPEKDQVVAPNLTSKPAPKLITPELEKEPPFPNEPSAEESKASLSTSKEVKKEEKTQKGKPGPKPKSK